MTYTKRTIDELAEEIGNAKVRKVPQINYRIVNTSEIEEPWKHRRWNEGMRKIRREFLRSGFHNIRPRKVKT